MKWIGIGFVLVSCSLGGFWLDMLDQKRVKDLEQVLYAFELLKGEINYRLTPLVEACMIVSNMTTDGVCELFYNFTTHLERHEEVDTKKMWDMAIDETRPHFTLKEEDFELISSFGSTAGYLDKELQKRNIELLIEKLTRHKDIVHQNHLRTGRMYKGLGVLIGLCLSIILV